MRRQILTLLSGVAALVLVVGPESASGAAGASTGPTNRPVAAVGQQQAPVPPCNVPRNPTDMPERTAEMRLARDGYGNYWQIQSGCRHQVVPFVMDAATLFTIPSGEDISFVNYGFPTGVPTPGPLGVPAYAQLPEWLRPAQAPEPTPAPPAGITPGTLRGYTNRVLVVQDGQPDVVYLLQGGIRHRVLVYYPSCVVYGSSLPPALCGGEGGDTTLDLSRAGDLYAYLLPRRVDADCSRLFPQLGLPPNTGCTDLYSTLFRVQGLRPDAAAPLAGFAATIAEIPLGEPAPYYGWAQGESQVLSDAVLPGASKCLRIAACTSRFLGAQIVRISEYDKDPGAFEGIDVRMEGTACEVRYDRETNATYFILRSGDIGVPAVARGRVPQRDPEFGSNVRMEIGAATSVRGGAVGVLSAGQLVVFEYRILGGSPCPPRSG